MKTEIVLFPNPNQLILLREMQHLMCGVFNSAGKLFAVPALPICVRCEKLQNLGDKITKSTLSESFFEKPSHSEQSHHSERSEESFVSLSVNLKINGENCDGKIELCKIFSENEINIEEKNQEVKEKCIEIISKIKKISPFRIVEMEIEECENGSQWKITREKWGKVVN